MLPPPPIGSNSEIFEIQTIFMVADRLLKWHICIRKSKIPFKNVKMKVDILRQTQIKAYLHEIIQKKFVYSIYFRSSTSDSFISDIFEKFRSPLCVYKTLKSEI